MNNLYFILSIETGMPVVLTYLLLLILKNQRNLTLKHGAILFIVLTMMGSMFNAISFYIDLGENFTVLFLAIVYVMFIMGGTVLYLIYFAIGRPFQGLTPHISRLVVGMIVWNEVSLGVLAFSLAYGGSPISGFPSILGGSSYILYMFSAGVNTYLFVTPMAAEMLVILFLTRARGLHLYTLLSLLSMAVFSPTLLGNSEFVRPGTLLVTASMIFFMVLLFEKIAKGKNSMKPEEKEELRWLFFAFAFMAGGIFFGTVYRTPFYIAWMPFAGAMAVTMGVYFNSVLRPIEGKEEKRRALGWTRNPSFMFIVLLSSFVAEWLLSASFMVQYSGTPLSILGTNSVTAGAGSFASLGHSLSGMSMKSPLALPLNLAFIVGVVTNSPWFWTIMGLEMSSLVVFRMLKVPWKEKKWNLGLAVAAFWSWTVFFQGTWWVSLFGRSAYRLPFWPNVGQYGPIFPVFLTGVVASYVIFAVLAFLFGRRSYCSTLCPSAVMYGGSLGQSMISYNYQSRFSRKNIGSKMKGAALSVAYSSWIIAILFAGISYYSVTALPGLSIFGVDTAVYYTTFIWNFLWYIFFISIPFVGMSPCRRYGWCSTGTLVGFFSKIGLFRLKVQSPDTCVTCPTKDCVTNCEVGLGDLPAQFIKKGEFKSSKCVGAGSCVEACPYDNIFFYDVRDLIRDRRSKKAENRS